MHTIEFPLGRGERLLWSGAPRQGIVFRPTDLFQIPFSLLWGGFALFWNVSVWASGAPIFFRLFGLPFLVVGLHLTVGRFWFDARRRARTSYGVTTERVIIASGAFTPSINSVALRTLSDVALTERPDGSGTIWFGPGSFAGSTNTGTPWPGMQQAPGFDLATDAKRVYDIIRDAQAAAARPAA